MLRPLHTSADLAIYSLYRGEEAGSHPAFPKHSKAAIVEFADGPVPANAPKIQYTKEDDKIIEQ